MRFPRLIGVTFRTDRRGNTVRRGRGHRAGAIAAPLILTIAAGVAAGIADHFRHLQQLLDAGTLILAGRTLNEDETMFGIVILEAGSAEEARRLMNEDPAVKGGIMTASLFPYRVALIRAGGE